MSTAYEMVSSATPAPLKIAFLVGGDTPATRLAMEAVARVPGIDITAVLVDTDRPPASRRFKNLRRNETPRSLRTKLDYDVYTNGAQLLAAARMPGTAFVSSGFIDTDRVFDHDRAKYPHRFENLTAEEVKRLPELGVDIGAHTVNHVDLGALDLETARREVFNSKQDLERITGKPVLLFSYPFGKIHNIREEVREFVREAGFAALFSAYGGFVSAFSDRWNIPRIGASSGHRGLDLMMHLEGIVADNLFRPFRHEGA